MKEDNGAIDMRKADQLKTLFNNMFSKEALRRNVYIFNALSPQMEIPLRKIMEERRVATITRHQATVKYALEQCTYIQPSGNKAYRILIPGDSTIIEFTFLSTKENTNAEHKQSEKQQGNMQTNQKQETNKSQTPVESQQSNSSQVASSLSTSNQLKSIITLPQNQKTLLAKLTKQMKCKIEQMASGKWRIQFASQAATRQFIERIKAINQEQDKKEGIQTKKEGIQAKTEGIIPNSKSTIYILKEEDGRYPVEVTLIQRNPYLCLSDAISAVKKQKSSRTTPMPMPQKQQFDYATYYHQLGYYYPVFIRRAIQSDEEEGQQSSKESHQTNEQRRRLDASDFPNVM